MIPRWNRRSGKHHQMPPKQPTATDVQHCRKAAEPAGERYRNRKSHIGIGMVHRGKLEKPAENSVAEHDQVSEVYHTIEGTTTLVLGPDITNRQRCPNTLRTVIEFNGPGNNVRISRTALRMA